MAEDIDISGLADVLGELLSGDEGKAQVQNILSMFGAGKNENSSPGMATGGINPDSIEMIFKLQQVMTAMNNPQNGKQTAFLQALRELLKPERRERIDAAVRFLNIGHAISAFKKIEGV